MAILQRIKLIGHAFDEQPFGAGITGRTDINTFSADYASSSWGDAGALVSCHARMGGGASWGSHSLVRHITLHDWVGLSARLGPDPSKAFEGAPSGPFSVWSARYYFKFNGMPGGDSFFGFPSWVSTLDVVNGNTKLDPLVCLNNISPRTNYGKLAVPGRTGYTSVTRANSWVRCEVQYNEAFSPQMVVRLYDNDDTTPLVVWSYSPSYGGVTGLALTSGDNGQVTTFIPQTVSIALLEFSNTYDLEGTSNNGFPGGTASPATTTNPSGTGTPETEQVYYTFPPDQVSRSSSILPVESPTVVDWQFASSPQRIATLTIPGGEPNNADGWPVVFWAFPGYFVGGSRLSVPANWVNTLVNAGYAVCSVGYIKSTLTTGAYGTWGADDGDGPGYGRYPSWIVDFKLAAARLPAAAAANGWNLDTDRIFATGYSAGGYIASASAVSEGVTDDGGGRNLTIAGNATYRDGYTGADPHFLGAYVYAPPVDLQAAVDFDLNDPGLPPVLLVVLLGYTGNRGSIAITARPFMGLTAGAADPDLSYTSVPELIAARDAIGDVPPVACVWGTGDYLIPKAVQSPPMAAAMAAAGATYTAIDAETIHDWMNSEFQPAPLLEFLDELVIDSGGLPGVLSPVDVVVEFAFGFGPNFEPGSGDWVDVTDYVDLTARSPGVRCSSGRTNPRQGIRPGDLDFVLDNRDGRFNPRNASGPYYGDLRNGTPVRVTTTYDEVTDVVWRGFVDSGWPQTITSRYPTVSITAHDVLGLLAQGEAPASAWAAFLKEYSPDHVWEPGPDGWIDSATGAVAPHTSALVEQPSGDDPIIDGAERAWGQTTPEGYGSTTDASAMLDTSTSDVTVLTRFKLVTSTVRDAAVGAGKPVVLVHQGTSNGEVPFTVLVYPDYVQVFASTTTFDRSVLADAGSVNLWDDKPHTVMVHAPEDSGDIRLWVDGRELSGLIQSSSAASNTISVDRLYLGNDPTDPASGTFFPYIGYIDPLVVWRDYVGDVDDLAVFGHAAATAAWAGQRLDERVTSIVEGMDVYDSFGAFDTSTVVTHQGYRQSEPLRLLQTIEDTEQGRVWVDNAGKLRFSARSWAWTDTVSNTVQITFSDDPALLDVGDAEEMLEGGTVIIDDPLNIVNVASVTSEHGRQQTAEDQASIAVYGRRNPLALSGLLHSSDLQSRSLAEWLIFSQADPTIQARQVSFRVEDNPAILAPIAAAIEEGWLVRIVKETTAETLDMQAHVIGVAHDFRFSGWTVTLTLDATRAGYSFFEWGSSTWGGADGWSF